MNLLARLFAYFITLPAFLLAVFILVVFLLSDVTAYKHGRTALQEMSLQRSGGPVWRASSSDMVFVSGELRGGPMPDSIIAQAPGFSSCVALTIKVSERWRSAKGSRRSRLIHTDTIIAAGASVAGHGIDRSLLDLKAMGVEPRRGNQQSPLGHLCPRLQSGHSCEVETRCLTPQPISLLGTPMRNDANTLSAPKTSLTRNSLPYALRGSYTPEKFAVIFGSNYKRNTLTAIPVVMLGFAYVFLSRSRWRGRGYFAVLFVGGLSLLPYQLLDVPTAPYAVIALLACSSLYIIAVGFSRPAPRAAAAPKPQLPAAVYLTPVGYAGLGDAPAKPVLTAPYDDLVTPALEHLKVRLSPLTLSALSPDQLERTVRMHVETLAGDRWRSFSDLQQTDLVARVITALKKQK